ncbi:GntR family transcriptional regulator [Kutzneria buriramensis]|uniref:GntR family transcriptional regulator n=1 Tax=Kutzneria buriramensis TaxID=1045776 RepID=A0A3E0IAI2_9PSEU|nr:GntR family transcriptional regulator [Kutzneria buriramensis]REH55677.1 GntR family transcriptional regulator [Kutzneria buriramensis]
MTPEEPPYRRIAADLRQAVERGEYRPGQQLPSGSALMKRYGVARQTVQNAFDALRAEGLVTTQPGAGVFVRTKPAVTRLARNRLSRAARTANQATFLGDAAASGFTASVEVEIRIETADEHLADALHIEAGDEILVRRRTMRADGEPVQLATSRLPRRLTAGTAIEQENTGPGGIYSRLEEAGVRLDHFVERVLTRPATVDEAALLNVAAGAPVLVVRRVAIDESGTPVEVNDMTMVGDRYELVYELAAD